MRVCECLPCAGHTVHSEVEEGTVGQPQELARERPFPSPIDQRFSAQSLFPGSWSSESSWGKAGSSCREPGLTGRFLLALDLVDSFVRVHLLCACQTLCQTLWAHSQGWGFLHWSAGGTWAVGNPREGSNPARASPVLERAQEGLRSISPSRRLRPREGRRLCPGHPAGPWHTDLDSLPPIPWVWAIRGGGSTV